MRAGPGIINPTVAASREWFVKNPYSEDAAFLRAQDFELWTRTANLLRIVHIDAPLIYYRCRSDADFEKNGARFGEQGFCGLVEAHGGA